MTNQLQTSDSYEPTAINPIDYLRFKSEQSANERTVASFKQAIDSFGRYVGGSELDFDDFDDALLGGWVSYLLYNGYSIKTTSYYVKRLASLYNKAIQDGLAKPIGTFSTLQSRLNNPQSKRYERLSDSDTFDKFQKIVRSRYTDRSERQLAKDIVLFAVYNGGLTFEEIVSYRKGDYKGDNKNILDIVERYSTPRNTYLFPLERTSRNTRQQASLVENYFRHTLYPCGLKISPNASDTAMDIWCMLAMACGISSAEISACVNGRRDSNAVTTFVNPSAISYERICEIRSQVITAITDNPDHWYAMHFRKNVSYDAVKDRLKETGIELQERYYPMEEIFRRVGHRRIFEKRPVISWLLFFRSRVSELGRLYREIGDLAWGYRQSRNIDSPYAVISQHEIDRYKLALGNFGEDTELYPEGAVQLQPGDRLVVLGGLLNGRPATFDSMTNAGNDKGKTVCRILLDGGGYKDWIVRQDIRLVKKITEEQFNDLRKQNLEK